MFADVADDLLVGAGVADFPKRAAMLGLVGESRKSVHFALAPVDSKVQIQGLGGTVRPDELLRTISAAQPLRGLL